MNETPNNRKKPPVAGGPPDRLQPKMLLIWVALAVAILILWIASTQSAANKTQKMSVSDVFQSLSDSKIHSLSITPNAAGDEYYDVQGTMDNPNAGPGDSPKENFAAVGRLTSTRYDELVSSALKKNIPVEE